MREVGAEPEIRHEVLSLLKQVARTAKQLSLSGDEVAAELRSLMEDKSK